LISCGLILVLQIITKLLNSSKKSNEILEIYE